MNEKMRGTVEVQQTLADALRHPLAHGDLLGVDGDRVTVNGADTGLSLVVPRAGSPYADELDLLGTTPLAKRNEARRLAAQNAANRRRRDERPHNHSGQSAAGVYREANGFLVIDDPPHEFGATVVRRAMKNVTPPRRWVPPIPNARTCTNANGDPKQQFATFDQAHEFAMTLNRAHAYRCVEHGWHVGTNRPVS